MHISNKHNGFTLLELMVTIAIMAIIFSFAIPAYQNMVTRGKLKAALGEWQSSFYLAQSEAMRLKSDVKLCASEDGQTCNATKNNFGKGWIILYGNRVIRDIVPKDNSITMTFKKDITHTLTLSPTGRIREAPGVGATFELSKNKQTIELNLSKGGRLSVQ